MTSYMHIKHIFFLSACSILQLLLINSVHKLMTGSVWSDEHHKQQWITTVLLYHHHIKQQHYYIYIWYMVVNKKTHHREHITDIWWVVVGSPFPWPNQMVLEAGCVECLGKRSKGEKRWRTSSSLLSLELNWRKKEEECLLEFLFHPSIIKTVYIRILCDRCSKAKVVMLSHAVAPN